MILVFWAAVFIVAHFFPEHGTSFMLGSIFGIVLTAIDLRAK